MQKISQSGRQSSASTRTKDGRGSTWNEVKMNGNELPENPWMSNVPALKSFVGFVSRDSSLVLFRRKRVVVVVESLCVLLPMWRWNERLIVDNAAKEAACPCGTTNQVTSRYEWVYESWKESKTKTLFVVFYLRQIETMYVGDEEEEGEKRQRKSRIGIR
jgi:hypothetical protein